MQQITNPVDANGNPTGQPVGPLRRIGGVLARIGDVAESIVAPGAAALTSGTTLHHQMLLNQNQGQIDSALRNQQSEAQTTLLDAQPELKKGALDLQNTKLQAGIQHQQDVLEQQKQHQHDAWVATLAKSGLAPDETDPSGQKVRPQRYEEMSEPLQAKEDLMHAQQEMQDANAALKKAQNDPTSPAYRLAKQRVDTASQNASTALGRLGLSNQEFTFNQDKFYNPQPTATERTKGDLAQSALERVQEMRAIKNKHPEWFGPMAGRAQNAQMAIGNQDPDMQTYQSAAQYLADHSAGVFGGRGQYILSQLHAITDPHSNPAAIGAALDEAERAAQGFVKAGAVHGKGGTSSYGGQGGNPPAQTAAPEGTRVQMPNGGFQVKRNGKWVAE